MNIHNFKDIINNVDVSAAAKTITVTAATAKVFANKSGLRYLTDTIFNSLNNVSNDIFYEYSIIASTLDSDVNKLSCFSCVVDSASDSNDPQALHNRVGRYSTDIISNLYKSKGYSIYHHPQLFIAPESNAHMRSSITVSFSTDWRKEQHGNYNKNIDGQRIVSPTMSNVFYAPEANETVYVQNMSFARSYSEMIENAKYIKENNITLQAAHEDLHFQYHKQLSDKIPKADRKGPYTMSPTCFISMPILGAQSTNIPERFKVGDDNKITNQGQGACFIFFKFSQSIVDNMEKARRDGEYEKFVADLKEDVISAARDLFLEINDYVRIFSFNYLFNVGMKLQSVARQEAIKAAKAAIMSRNMSHNLGSHVMAYLKQKLNSVEDIVREKTLADLISVDDDNNCTINSNITAKLTGNLTNSAATYPLKATDITTNIELPFLVGLGKFVNYLQERQDFIATVATSYIPYSSPVNFKDYIYDELTPDLRQIRHSDRSGSRPENILLAYIARSENLIREVEVEDSSNEFRSINTVMDYVNANDIIKLTFRDFMGVIEPDKTKGDDAKQEYEEFYKRYTPDDNKNMVKSLEEMKNYNFSLPGGVIGRQAIFSIIENVIRNAAKHGIRTDVDNVELAFDIFDLSNSADKKRINELSEGSDCGVAISLMPEDAYTDIDGIKSLKEDHEHLTLSFKELLLGENSPYKNAKDISELYIFTITDKLDIQIPALCKLCSAINTKYLDEQTGSMENTAKGLKEIRISAVWLRILDDSIDGVLDDRAPLVTVRAAKTLDGKYNLQYVLCIPKPRNVAFISQSGNVKSKFTALAATTDNKSLLEEQLTLNGWCYFTEEEWMNPSVNKSFDLIVVESESEDSASELEVNIGNISPDRIVRMTQANIQSLHKAAYQSEEKENAEAAYQFGKAQEYLWNKMLIQKKRMTNVLVKLEDDRLVYADEDDLDTSDAIHIEDSRAHSNFCPKTTIVDDFKNKISFIDEDEGDEIYFNSTLKQVIIHSTFSDFCRPDEWPEDETYGPKYLYRTHHGFDSSNSISSFLGQSLVLDSGDYTRTKFVEGITGHNATDRIVRSTDIDLTWYFKQVNAMETKVAVIDERIFRKITGVNDSTVLQGIKSESDPISIKDCLRTEGKTATLYLQKGISAMNIILNYTMDNKELEEIMKKDDGSDPIIAEFIVVATDALYMPGYENIIAMETLTEENAAKDDTEKKNEKTPFAEEARIAHLCTISIRHSGAIDPIKKTNEFSDRCLFDYITIHQGLLDKVYNKIANVDTKVVDEFGVEHRKKELVTNKLKEIFIMDSKEYGNLVIHSGRSKPSLKDMPQQVPFVQFSGIDSSVSDSKTTLVELLNFARYEDTNK